VDILRKVGLDQEKYPFREFDALTLMKKLSEDEVVRLTDIVFKYQEYEKRRPLASHEILSAEEREKEDLHRCCICLDDYEPEDIIRTRHNDKCAGHYHENCLITYFNTPLAVSGGKQIHCPFCKHFPCTVYSYKCFSTYDEFMRERSTALRKEKKSTNLKLTPQVQERLFKQVIEHIQGWSFGRLHYYTHERLKRYATDPEDYPYGTELLIMHHEQCKDKIIKKTDYCKMLSWVAGNYYVSSTQCPLCNNYCINELYTEGHKNPRTAIFRDFVLDDDKVNKPNSVFKVVTYDEHFLREYIKGDLTLKKKILEDLIDEGVIKVPGTDS
jgi:hypothetical protein